MGLFVTFEGGEGAGKSTLMRRLFDHFTKEQFPVVKTREPGGTPFGEELRSFLLHHPGLQIGARAELFLFLASRAQHVEEYIRPHLKRGDLILCDRFSDSTVAYQGAGRHLGVSFVEEACLMATSQLEPHLTIYLDVDPKVGLSRAKNRGAGDRIEHEKVPFHIAVRDAFLALAERNAHRFVVLDGVQPQEVLFEQALEHIMKRWKQ